METSAAIEAAQPARLKAALDALSPRDPRDLNIFALGIAGSNEGDVFAKENAKALAILGERFHLAGRSLTLANTDNPDDASPAASIENIASALNGLKQRMDLDRDILVLSMTSHGSPYGFQLAGSGYDRILSPRLLNAMLKDAGIKNRIIIVSACASGVFVPALANDNTVVITAAAKDRSSFGCDSDREWTYFGDAFFAHGLKESSTLAEAFGKARRQVAIWEAEKDYTPSEPQIFVGKEIARQFPRIVGPETSASSLKRAPLRGPLRSAAR